MKRLLFIGLLFVFIANAKSQVETYSGQFESGTATYQYYMNDDMDRIFHGPFHYEGSLYNIEGSYSNGKKTGKWEINAKDKLFSAWRGDIVLNTKIFGHYRNGSLSGDWYYSNSIRFKTDDHDDMEISSASFLNNHFVGKFTYEANWPVQFYITGYYDSLGNKTGTWIYKRGNLSDEIRFVNGVASWRLFYDIINGKKIVYCDSVNFVSEFWAAYDTRTNSAIVNGKKYQTDTIRSSFRASGSKVVKIGDPGIHSGYNTDNPISVWTNATVNVFASGSLDNPLYYYSQGSFQPTDWEIIILECDRYSDCYELSGKEKQELRDKEFRALIEEADWRFNSNSEERKATAIQFYLNALEIKEDDYARKQLSALYDFFKKRNKRKELLDEVLVLEKNVDENKSSLLYNEELKAKKKKYLQSVYFTISDFLFKALWAEHSEIRKDLMAKGYDRISYPKIEEYHSDLTVIINFQEIILRLATDDTNELEKKLKKLTSSEGILELLLLQ